MREPACATRLGVLTVAGAHVRAVSAYLEPLAQEALVISGRESLLRGRHLSQWMSESLEKTIGKIAQESAIRHLSDTASGKQIAILTHFSCLYGSPEALSPYFI